MKTLLAATFFILISSFVYADGYVKGYTRKDGTYVQPHYRSERNTTPTDNYGYKDNTNPYTGEKGHNRDTNNPNSPYYNPFK